MSFKSKGTFKINETVAAELNYPGTVFLKCMIHLNILMFFFSREAFKL
jgi:hypothetical protein